MLSFLPFIFLIWKQWLRPCQDTQQVGASSVHPKVAGLIPTQGTYLSCGFYSRLGCVWETMDRCSLSLFLFLFLSPQPPPFFSLRKSSTENKNINKYINKKHHYSLVRITKTTVVKNHFLCQDNSMEKRVVFSTNGSERSGY